MSRELQFGIANILGYYYSYPQLTGGNDSALERECNMSIESFRDHLMCDPAYEAIVTDRDPNCTSKKELLCSGTCAQRAKRIACKCQNVSRRRISCQLLPA